MGLRNRQGCIMTHRFENKFDRVSDFMERYYVSASDKGPRPGAHYRGELRNAARIAYRVAKKTLKAQQNG